MSTANLDALLSSVWPDTFASKVAAIQDQYADASIGNVTGSNAVNVFLGIGVSPPYVFAGNIHTIATSVMLLSEFCVSFSCNSEMLC